MRKVLLSRISFSALMLTFLTFIFLFFSFSSSLEISQWDKGNPSGTYINQTLELNETQFETGEPATIKTSWLTSFIESISKWANYWTKTENINQTGYNITADYFIGNGSQLTGIPSPDLNGLLKLDQTTPQTIINGAPKFTKSFIAAKTITDTSLIESMTGGEQAGIFQINPYWDYGIIFSSVGDNPYPLYNSFLKSRSPNGITRKAVKTGDQLGLIEFVGDSGTYYVGGAEIKAEVIATPGTATMPTDLIFGTNFNSGLIQERWRLTSIGDWVPKADNQKVYFGAGKDASITYNGANLIINPKVVGSGILDVAGTLQTDGYNSADGSQGWTGNCVNASYKDGIIVGCND